MKKDPEKGVNLAHTKNGVFKLEKKNSEQSANNIVVFKFSRF